MSTQLASRRANQDFETVKAGQILYDAVLSTDCKTVTFLLLPENIGGSSTKLDVALDAWNANTEPIPYRANGTLKIDFAAWGDTEPSRITLITNIHEIVKTNPWFCGSTEVDVTHAEGLWNRIKERQEYKRKHAMMIAAGKPTHASDLFIVLRLIL